MRATIKRKVNLSVLVDVVVEWNKAVRQCVIVDSKIDPLTPITPRMIYEALRPGDFSQLDQDASRELSTLFNDLCWAHRNTHPDNLPEMEIRGLPVHVSTWSNWMKETYGAYMRFPVPMAMEIFRGLERDILVEPVLSRTQHAYIWNARPERTALDTVVDRAKKSTARFQTSPLPEGCLRIQTQKQEK